MGLSSALGSLLIFLGLCGICTGFVKDCTDYKLQFERVFSVPGDIAMLNSTLVSPDIFNFKTIPYNITWYFSKTSQEISNQTGRIFIRGETLWLLNVTLDDDGEYVTILRTPSQCYRQVTKLVVDLPVTGQCGRPRKTEQTLTSGVNDKLNCPLKDYINKLNSYNIATFPVWYKGCEPIVDGQAGRYTYEDTILRVKLVEAHHKSSYTCTLKFTIGGIMASVSETIDAVVSEKYFLNSQVLEPVNEVIKAKIGSSFSKRCQVFVPGIGTTETVSIFWFARGNEIQNTKPSQRIYVSEQHKCNQIISKNGECWQKLLMFSELNENDFHIKYTCQALTSRDSSVGHFTLLPADPNIILPIGAVLGGLMVHFIICVIVYYIFKVDIVLWFRKAFPFLYTNKDLDGRLYDAYVAYPQPGAVGFSKNVETFALHILPQVLENVCGYKLFIAGRDCVPGQDITNSVEENLQASRCLLLLYTASTFTSKSHTSSTSNMNKMFKCGDSSDSIENKISGNSNCTSFEDSDVVCPDTRQQLECGAAMHRALLEGTLKVILVELEEITRAQLAVFPESVRHLRKKQGAVCWWKNLRTRKRWRMCISSRQDEMKTACNTQASPSLSPSSRFWKEIRYHMPVRGQRVVYPEETALLNL